MTNRLLTLAALAAAVFLAPSATRAQKPAIATAAPTAVTPAARLFAFHSAFWLNMHEFLYAQSRSRLGLERRPAMTSSLADTSGLGPVGNTDRQTWERALRYYSAAIARHDILFDSASIRVSNELAEQESASSLSASGLDPQLVAVLREAGPVYRKIWWARHDAANREWIASHVPLVDRYGDDLARTVTSAFRTRWPDDPIRVDVTTYATWAGAYTTEHPSRITVSSLIPGNQGEYGLEMLFHESLHTMDGVIDSSLTASAKSAGKSVTYNLTHAVVFYTAGAAVARLIPDYKPFGYSFGIWSGPLGHYEPLLAKWWQRYLDGVITLDAAERGMVSEL